MTEVTLSDVELAEELQRALNAAEADRDALSDEVDMLRIKLDAMAHTVKSCFNAMSELTEVTREVMDNVKKR